MKNKGLIIAAIIFLTIVIVCLISILFMAINHSFHFNDWSEDTNNVIFNTSYELDEIKNLTILSSMGDIELKENMENKIQVEVFGEKTEDVNVNLEDGELKVDYAKYKSKHIFWGFNSFKREIDIYLPKDYSGQITINTNYGDVEAIDLENATMNVDSDCGDIKLGKIKEVFIDSNYGDVDIKEILNKVSVKSDCGDVKVNSLTITENSEIESNLGDIKIGKTNDVFIDAKTDLGDVKVDNNNRYADITLKISNDCGDIKVEN